MLAYHTIVSNLAEIKTRAAMITTALNEDVPPSERLAKIKEIMEKGDSRWNAKPFEVLAEITSAAVNIEHTRVQNGMEFIATMLGQDSRFVSKVSEEVAGSIDASDVAGEIDTASIAQEISARDIADEIDLQDVADRIDLSDLASSLEIDPASLAAKAVKDNENDIVCRIVDEMSVHFGERMKDEVLEEVAERVCEIISIRLTKSCK